ncbi:MULTISPECIES: 3'(2'),5'-bisphosphate nucleotidase CysQ [Asticcacaulis]|uniref:inositol monophosphatase family protein n=1 Tax=Asticcacaulis TaxID=76890 RepID=UPI001AEB075A|nr:MULTISPECIES: 3'(2'),5'-bisphosphate nucleotidase CysQ [Asticcacaulis]MBP2160634.1 myo-inositol-1(or 4)-monophosphatase [Asticcacaulis solisilvae]MDR6801679.1 myo-inositol-1(or 4)-monophosphatase [Asticcacaulis sp. BE141]
MASAVAATDLDLIIDKVRRAGALAQHLKAHGLITSFKADGSIVTNADTEVNLWLKEALLEARPDYGWQSEESPDNAERLNAARTFVLDPIDGTMGLSKGSPYWTIALAIVEAGRPIAAVVYAPDAHELFSAAAGQGTKLNDQPVHARDRQTLEDAEVVGDSRLFSRDIWPETWPRLSVQSRPSVAYRMCVVAAGRADFTMALTPKRDWDVAAATLIAQEAGAVVSDHLGNPYGFNAKDSLKPSLICSGPALFPEIIRRCAHLLTLENP